MHRYQYSLYYYEQAKVCAFMICMYIQIQKIPTVIVYFCMQIVAEDFSYHDLKFMCELNEACIMKNSTQVYELEQAKKYFTKLIPKLENDIKQHTEEDTLCPKYELQQRYFTFAVFHRNYS